MHAQRTAPLEEAKAMIEVGDELLIADDELEFRTGTSSGPARSKRQPRAYPSDHLLQRLVLKEPFGFPERAESSRTWRSVSAKKASSAFRSQRHRTQQMNREAAEQRLAELLVDALHIPRPRRKTKSPAQARERRLEEKKRRSRLKRDRTGLRPTELQD